MAWDSESKVWVGAATSNTSRTVLIFPLATSHHLRWTETFRTMILNNMIDLHIVYLCKIFVANSLSFDHGCLLLLCELNLRLENLVDS